LKESLLQWLVCPECRGKLTCDVLKSERLRDWTEIDEGRLECISCAADYPIRAGVPRLVPRELDREVERTASGFGYEWREFDETIQDTYMTSRTNFLDFIHPTTDSFFKDKVVLDAGCGMGRFLKLGAEFGSREIIGVDLSEAVDVAYRNTRELPHVHVVQGNLLSLPLERRFDYIFSVGVLQFLPDPRAGFLRLAEQLEPGGRFSLWVYSKENNAAVRILSPLRKYLTSRMPRPWLHGLSNLLGTVVHGVVRGIYKPANEGSLGFKWGRFLPYNDYLYYNARLTRGSIASVVFDHLVPPRVAYLTRSEIENWFHAAGLSDVTIGSRNNMSWRGQATRAAG